MKKIILCLGIFLFVLTGCTDMTNTPSKKVEEFLGKYQSMDKDVLNQLDKIVKEDETMTDDEKTDYKSLMEKQYQNLSYKIKSEEIKGNSATVDVEIEVFDYVNSINKTKEYYAKNKSEFVDENNNLDNKKFIDYKIKELKKVTDKIKYQMTFNLTKSSGKWTIDDISDSDLEKIHGLYVE